jgi:hypothetical protein
MKRITAFTWGYWGWGTHAADFVRNVDAVERARGWRPPLFVDIRIRRTVRAPDFQQNAFEKIVGQRRYRWMKSLGNRSIITKGRRMEIADPNAANDLLEHVLQAHDQKRRVLFFCACEYPGIHSPNCHRATVAGLLLKAAHRKGVRLTVAEWPGGEPRTAKLRTSPHVVKKVLSGATRLPLAKLSQKDRLKFNALPWCSRVKLFSEESSLAIISGPPRIDREWFLPILGCYRRRIVVARPPGSAKGRSAAHRGQQHPLQTTFFAVSVTMSIRATDKFVVGVACERAVGFSA